MADDEYDYKVGPGRPPLHTRFRKGQSGNPGGRSKKKLHALLADALNEPAFLTVDGERRKITKREAVVHQLVNKSATADLRATKMLFDMIKEVEQKASVTSPTPEPRRLDAAVKEVEQTSWTGYESKSWPRSPQRASRRQGGNVTADVVTAAHSLGLRSKPQ
jgi:hypothetical protein